jgi:hypothetical protein
MKKTFEYSQILYNEAIMYLETKWNRKLNEHERNVLIEGYRFGRMIEAEDEIKIIFTK